MSQVGVDGTLVDVGSLMYLWQYSNLVKLKNIYYHFETTQLHLVKMNVLNLLSKLVLGVGPALPDGLKF